MSKTQPARRELWLKRDRTPDCNKRIALLAVGIGGRHMRNYRLTFWGKTGCREGTFPLMADTEKDALDRGSKMLSRSDCTRIEVWRDTSLLARVDRDGASIPAN
jgi:hypothetical protein